VFLGGTAICYASLSGPCKYPDHVWMAKGASFESSDRMKPLECGQCRRELFHSRLPMRTRISTILLAILAATMAGCVAHSRQITSPVSKGIEERTGHGLASPPRLSVPTIPPGVDLADGLTEDEAVAIALWNNAAFQTDLTALGFARADLLEAGLLRNPLLTLLFPIGPKQMETTAIFPIEILWQRPRRVAAARLDLDRVAEGLVQNGLNLVRDVQVGYADLVFAKERASIATQAVQERAEIAELVEARLRAGDVSELETSQAQTDARLAEEQATRFKHEVILARDRLRSLLGLGMDEIPFEIAPTAEEPPVPEKLDLLIKQALAARPDLRAAELGIEAAGSRAKWEHSRIMAISAMIDTNSRGQRGFEAGPGLQLELPFFNHNQGGVTRAEAEVERAARHYAMVRQRIVLEVQEAHTLFLQALESLRAWQRQILPPLQENLGQSQKAYAAGDVSYLFVLESTRRLTDARLREAEAKVSLHRAAAQFQRSVGKKLGSNS